MMIAETRAKKWLFKLLAIGCLQSTAFAQTSTPLPETSEGQTDATHHIGLTPAQIAQPPEQPHRGYLIELVAFKNTQYTETGEADDNDYSLPNARATNRTTIYPATGDELHQQLPRLQSNTLYQPIAYTAWRQISRPRSDSPTFQLNEIAPELTGTVMVYDNVILLTEVDIEYNPALGAAARTTILDVPEPKAAVPAEPIIVGENLNLENGLIFSEGLTANQNLSLVPEYKPFTGEYFPKPYNPEEYIYRQVSDQSARHLINERRRVKFEETHYFDHPAFGILLRVIHTEIPVNEYNLSEIESLGIPAFSTTDLLPMAPPNPGSLDTDKLIRPGRSRTTPPVPY